MNISDQKHFEWTQMMHRNAISRLQLRAERARVRGEELRVEGLSLHGKHNEASKSDPPPRR